MATNLGVNDRSFQRTQEKELSVKSIYLFSRHKGILQAKLADLASGQKLVNVGDEQWQSNKSYAKPGGSTKVCMHVRVYMYACMHVCG